MSVGSLSLKQGGQEGVGASFAAEFGKRGLNFLIGRDFPTRHLCAGLVDRRQFLRRGVVRTPPACSSWIPSRYSSTSSSRSSGSRSRAINQALSLGRHACHSSHSAFGWTKRKRARALGVAAMAPVAWTSFLLCPHYTFFVCPASRPGGRRRTRCSAPCGRCRLRSEDGGPAGPVRPIRQTGRWGDRQQATRT